MYNTLMNAYGMNSTKAEKVLTRMKKAGVKPDVTTYTTLMNACRRHPSKAQKYFKEMLSLKFKPDKHTFATLIVAHARQRDTKACLLYTSPSPRDRTRSRMPSSA